MRSSHLTRRKRGLALASRGRRDLAALAALLHTLVLLARLLDAAATAARDVGSVAEVGVDADHLGDTLGLDVLDHDFAGTAVVGAVAAAAVELAGVDDGEVLDGDGALAVVLDDLVLGLLGAATLDEDIAAAQSRNGICEHGS